ncbi:uracil-DNA glycosylase family protein [Falsihalocynthiibacter sp. SS001]|uniref:uracil-DNA glycosylase family protein n=1 Tax=Falsihalocynthiibacter sp. SS001 TaxID=3349698 RepID=UPI0036D2E812
MSEPSTLLMNDIAQCTLCADRFARTKTSHRPRPIVWYDAAASILIAGQAPGMRVHESGRPFDDASGDRLRDWMGITRDKFYDRKLIAIVPMAFCFPGYDASGSDLPPPRICRATWHDKVMETLAPKLTILVGGYAHKYHLQQGAKATVPTTVKEWVDHAPRVFPLPHPSWRNTGWIRKNPWFEAELLPALRKQVQEVLLDD